MTDGSPSPGPITIQGTASGSIATYGKWGTSTNGAISTTATVVPEGALVVSTCGTAALPVGSMSTLRVDTMGRLCTNGTGGGTDGLVTADGMNVAQGSTSDAPYAGSGNGTVISLLKAIYARTAQVSMPVNSVKVGRIQIYNDGPSILMVKLFTDGSQESQWMCPGKAGCVFNDIVTANGTISIDISNTVPAATATQMPVNIGYAVPKPIKATQGFTMLEVFFIVVVVVGTMLLVNLLNKLYWPWRKNKIFNEHMRRERDKLESEIKSFDTFISAEEEIRQGAEFDRFKSAKDPA